MKRRETAALCAVLLTGCVDSPGGGLLVPTFPLFVDRPVDHVVVYTWPKTMQVGDTMSISTDSFDANGQGTGSRLNATWTFSDSGLVERTGMIAPNRRVLLRGLRIGLLRVTANVSGKTDSDTVRVIPALAPLRADPASLTIRRGDSARVRLIVRDLGGGDVNNLIVFWETRDQSLVYGGCCRDTLTVRLPSIGGTGATQLVAKTANLSVAIPVTVTP